MKKAAKIAVSVLLWIVILLAALFAFITLATRNQANVASIAGITPLVIESDSMKPTFETGDLIFIKKTDTSKLQEGDVITFHTIIDNKYVLNTHRIIKIYEEDGIKRFATQGDNNELADQRTIVEGDIVGKYMNRWKGFGKVVDILKSKIGFFLIIVLPMLIFFIYQVYHLVMVSIELKKATAIEAALASEEAVQAMKEAKSEENDNSNEPKEPDTNNNSTEDQNAKLAEAEKALEEARRMKAEAEAALAEAKALKDKE